MGTRGYKRGHKEYMKQYFRANPKKYLLSSSRKRAKIAGIEHSITENDFEIPEYCPVFGERLTEVRSKDANAPSLDRKDNTKGYIPGNICVISWRANKYKSNMSLNQLEALYLYALSANR